VWKISIKGGDELTKLFNSLIGSDFKTTEDVKNAIDKTRKNITTARKMLRNVSYLKILLRDTVVPMCGGIDNELYNKASELLDKIERTELDLKDYIAHTEGRLDWLYEQLEKMKNKK